MHIAGWGHVTPQMLFLSGQLDERQRQQQFEFQQQQQQFILQEHREAVRCPSLHPPLMMVSLQVWRNYLDMQDNLCRLSNRPGPMPHAALTHYLQGRRKYVSHSLDQWSGVIDYW